MIYSFKRETENMPSNKVLKKLYLVCLKKHIKVIKRQKKKRLKYLILEPGVRRTLQLLNQTPRMPFNVC